MTLTSLTAADLVSDARRQSREIGPHQFAAQPGLPVTMR